jgi:spore germination protein YaaH
MRILEPLLAAALAAVFIGCATVIPEHVVQPNPQRPGQTEENNEAGNQEHEETGELEYSENPRLPVDAALPVSDFDEVWAYLRQGREKYLTPGLPITDLIYFSCSPDSTGQLSNIPDSSKLANFPGRIHLCFTCFNQALTHFILEPGEVRSRLIHDLVEAVRPYNGLNIDMESVGDNDADNFYSFLKELKSKLKGKTLSVALAAHPRSGGTYDYRKIAPIADRIFVMAYDEHWGTSKPGPIASFGWCKQVADDSLDIAGEGKVIMGVPFYGRKWSSISTSGSLHYGDTEDLPENATLLEKPQRKDFIPMYKYQVPVTVTVYYEDVESLAKRAALYETEGVKNIGFWTLGQEDEKIWDYIRVKPAAKTN